MNNYYTETQRFSKWWYLLLIGIVLINVIYLINSDDYDVTKSIWWFSLLFPIIFLGFFLILRLDTKINSDGISFRFYPLKSNYFKWNEIISAQVREYKPIGDFMGWGIRFGLNGIKAYTTTGNMGLQIELLSGKKYLLGTQKPEDIERICNHFKIKKP